jgi:hypothetical protein
LYLFPSATSAGAVGATQTIGRRGAREAKGLTWFAVAKLEGIPNSGTIRDSDAGRDTQLSNVQAVAQVLGLRLELVEENV